ncbi:MAG: ComEC/Rec2 family competence protein [Candidatus Woesebacteria bacterium]|nr:ComEC/Rec2 family competence protein [Candidatus Woesebacteria bacterium]
MQEPVRYSFKQKIDLLGFYFYLPLYPEVNYGDAISVKGKVKNGELINTELISISSGNNFLFGFRKKIIAFYRKTLPEPHASLVAGITLGSKSQIPEKFWEDLKKSGVIHVVVASGMNVTFVAGFLINLLTVFLSRKKALIFAILGIWLYVAISGFEAPLIRAGIMITFAFWAQGAGRLSFSWRVLLITALIMLIYDPSWTFDIGFILSFVATASLMLFQKRVNNYLKFVPSFLKEGLSTSIAAQIGVAPILFVTFGQFNILSPAVNMLILWTIPPIMILGAMGGILGLIFPFLGRLILYLSYPLTWWFNLCVSGSTSL